MQEFSYPLGDAIKRARGELGLTQSQVAEKSGIDARTVMNIENYKGNPKMEVLYPLVRALKLDSRGGCKFFCVYGGRILPIRFRYVPSSVELID